MPRIFKKSSQIILITGAARSGKSEWAEKLADKTELAVTYIATANIDETDLEWQARISKHQQRRPQNWKTETTSIELAQRLDRATREECLLIDSLGTWLVHFLDSDGDSWQKVCDRLVSSLQTTEATVILVGEETGWGVVPAYKSGRVFRDRLGHLIRQIGGIANPVYLVAGGHILNLSILGEPLDG